MLLDPTRCDNDDIHIFFEYALGLSFKLLHFLVLVIKNHKEAIVGKAMGHKRLHISWFCWVYCFCHEYRIGRMQVMMNDYQISIGMICSDG